MITNDYNPDLMDSQDTDTPPLWRLWWSISPVAGLLALGWLLYAALGLLAERLGQ
ncbi:MAG: hypothetical protein ACYDCO_25560 [Armatimonadota bacterium]